MKNHKQIITKEMVTEKLCIVITSLETEYNLTMVQSHFHKKRIEYACNLLQKLMANKIPPALIYLQMKRQFAQVKRQGKVHQSLRREISLRISDPINLN